MKRAAVGYYRTSGEAGKSNRGFGLETQKREVRKYCKDNGFELLKEFEDNGVSGTELEKSYGLIEMLSSLNGEEIVISKSSCRLFGRGDYRQVMVKRELKKAGKKVIFTDNPSYDIEENDPSQFLINSMMELLDTYERMAITLRLSKSRRNKARGGSKGSGRTPLGYKWETINNERVVVVNEEMKKVVEFLFLNYDPEIRTTTLRGLERQVKEHFDIKLTSQGIRSILTNDFYIGKVTHGDLAVDGSHETFITKHRFTKVGKLLKIHKKK